LFCTEIFVRDYQEQIVLAHHFASLKQGGARNHLVLVPVCLIFPSSQNTTATKKKSGKRNAETMMYVAGRCCAIGLAWITHNKHDHNPSLRRACRREIFIIS
jgi:ABC-type iron transport system FetAB ATPase subunit